MGFHVSWITVRGKAPSTVLSELGLVETLEKEFVPESDVSGVVLPSGWYMVFFNDPMPQELGEEILAALSREAEVAAFVVEEASMVSLARGYANGRRSWEVVHDSSEGYEHLDVSGTLPTQFAEVEARLRTELAKNPGGADYLFDVPAELCKAITGFRHDEDVEGLDGDVFVVLDRL